ncbi:hypothetical protein NMY22_g18100 [Coprinellus aureogranulatus]|nr:hypothetical protein NMY22_g18100 [Coprinellus aureogranulatus]
MSQEPEEDVKPKININIQYEGQNVQVKVKGNTKFAKIFDSVEPRLGGGGVTPGTFKFVFEGQRIQRDDTPASIGLEDGDQIDAFLMQVRINLSTRVQDPNAKSRLAEEEISERRTVFPGFYPDSYKAQVPQCILSTPHRLYSNDIIIPPAI